MRLTSGYEERKARIELLPLMDVMFLILVFFVYSIFSMSVHRGLKVDLPTGQGAHLREEPILLTLTADNELFLNKQAVSFEECVEQTLKMWEAEPSAVLISADRSASLGTGIELLGKLKNGGIERIAFQVNEREKSSDSVSSVP